MVSELQSIKTILTYFCIIYKNIIFVPLFENYDIDMATTAFFYYTEFLCLSTSWTLTLLNQ